LVGVLCVLGDPVLELLGKERGPRLAQDAADDFDAVVAPADEKFVEEALVGVAPHLRAAFAVDAVNCVDVRERCVEGLFDAGVNQRVRAWL
jgi:hypothetical protein